METLLRNSNVCAKKRKDQQEETSEKNEISKSKLKTLGSLLLRPTNFQTVCFHSRMKWHQNKKNKILIFHVQSFVELISGENPLGCWESEKLRFTRSESQKIHVSDKWSQFQRGRRHKKLTWGIFHSNPRQLCSGLFPCRAPPHHSHSSGYMKFWCESARPESIMYS